MVPAHTGLTILWLPKNKKKTLKVSKLTSCMNFRMIQAVINPFLTSPTNRYPPGYGKRMWRSIRSILPIATKFGQWLDIIISQLNAKFRLDTVYHRVARRIWISSFCEAIMAHRRGANYYSSEESTMLFFGRKQRQWYQWRRGRWIGTSSASF